MTYETPIQRRLASLGTGLRSRQDEELARCDGELSATIRKIRSGRARFGGQCMFCSEMGDGLCTKFPEPFRRVALCTGCRRSMDHLYGFVQSTVKAGPVERSNSARARRYFLLLSAMGRLAKSHPKTFKAARELLTQVQLFTWSLKKQNDWIAHSVLMCACPDLEKEIGRPADELAELLDLDGLLGFLS